MQLHNFRVTQRLISSFAFVHVLKLLRAVGCFYLGESGRVSYCHSECQWCSEIPAVVKWPTKQSQAEAILVSLYCPHFVPSSSRV